MPRVPGPAGASAGPAPSRRRGANFRPVPLSPLQCAKVELYTAFVSSGFKKAEYARRIGIPKTHVERLFSLRHQSRLDQIEAAFAALGRCKSYDCRWATRPRPSVFIRG